MYIRYGCDQKSTASLVLSDGQESSADVEIEDVLLAGARRMPAYSIAAIEGGALGPCPWTVSADTPAAAAIFASVVRAYRIGEQLRRGIEDPQPRRLRLLLTQLRI